MTFAPLALASSRRAPFDLRERPSENPRMNCGIMRYAIRATRLPERVALSVLGGWHFLYSEGKTSCLWKVALPVLGGRHFLSSEGNTSCPRRAALPVLGRRHFLSLEGSTFCPQRAALPVLGRRHFLSSEGSTSCPRRAALPVLWEQHFLSSDRAASRSRLWGSGSQREEEEGTQDGALRDPIVKGRGGDPGRSLEGPHSEGKRRGPRMES
ncbi:hypothetical protein EYF80_054186 [Liparis tanakae]|uniref:Uncharacterized protein n=1 Tax=Liparis tanakae TaxID=230148 RepID=A0A4Z2F4H3_9TELE|nr:hypothetical protein EYF80_054186 [Liparis tanakae]